MRETDEIHVFTIANFNDVPNHVLRALVSSFNGTVQKAHKGAVRQVSSKVVLVHLLCGHLRSRPVVAELSLTLIATRTTVEISAVDAISWGGNPRATT